MGVAVRGEDGPIARGGAIWIAGREVRGWKGNTASGKDGVATKSETAIFVD